MFAKILEVSLSDSELDDLAKKLEGYQIAGENPPKSTGRVDVVIQKSGDNGSYSPPQSHRSPGEKGLGRARYRPRTGIQVGRRRPRKSC